MPCFGDYGLWSQRPSRVATRLLVQDERAACEKHIKEIHAHAEERLNYWLGHLEYTPPQHPSRMAIVQAEIDELMFKSLKKPIAQKHANKLCEALVLRLMNHLEKQGAIYGPKVREQP